MLTTIVVVPSFNEEKRLELATFRRFVDANPTIGLLLVNDGSSDGTAAMLNLLAAARPQQIQSLHLPANVGKAEAVRQGMLAAFAQSPRYVAYWDADLATPLDAAPLFAGVLARRPEVDIVLGSRLPLLGRRIERRWKRAQLGRLFAACASRVLGLSIYDTQCGAKMFRVSQATQTIFADPFHSRWIFDVELLARWQCLGRSSNRLYEWPLEVWCEVPGSKLTGRDFIRAIGELLNIYRTYRGGYEPAIPAVHAVPAGRAA